MNTYNEDTDKDMNTYYVYELNNGKNEHYYGVTKNPKRRLWEHQNKKDSNWVSSAKLGNNIEMNILQEYDNLVDARLSEELLIRNCCCVNSHIPSNIIIKWQEGEFKENHRVYSREWHITNRERISKQKKIYYQNNKEHIKARVKNYHKNKTI